MFPKSQGPSWLYASLGLIVFFQYYIWAFEMASYWFKTEEEKIILLIDNTVVDRWLKLSLYWGGALTLLTLAMIPG
jgi:hypothetical protein